MKSTKEKTLLQYHIKKFLFNYESVKDKALNWRSCVCVCVIVLTYITIVSVEMRFTKFKLATFSEIADTVKLFSSVANLLILRPAGWRLKVVVPLKA